MEKGEELALEGILEEHYSLWPYPFGWERRPTISFEPPCSTALSAALHASIYRWPGHQHIWGVYNHTAAAADTIIGGANNKRITFQ